MPKWIHERAEHLLAKNPDMGKSTAFAIATQQGEATGHTPKGFGTAEGRATSKAKYDTPKDDQQKANPGNLETPKLKAAMHDAFVDELAKIAAAEKDSGFLSDAAAGVKKALTTPIPGTPEMPGVHDALSKLRGLTGGAAGAGASKGFKAFQAARAAAGH